MDMASLHAMQERQMMLCVGGPELLASSAPPGSAALDLRATHSRWGVDGAGHGADCTGASLHRAAAALKAGPAAAAACLPAARRLVRDKGLGPPHWELFVGPLPDAPDSLPTGPP